MGAASVATNAVISAYAGKAKASERVAPAIALVRIKGVQSPFQSYKGLGLKP